MVLNRDIRTSEPQRLAIFGLQAPTADIPVDPCRSEHELIVRIKKVEAAGDLHMAMVLRAR